MSAAVETTDLVKQYSDVTALRGVDLRIERGEIFGVIGPNGAGKTTMMRVLLDIIRPTSGHVEVLGENPRSGGGELRRRIGYLPGELRLQGRTTVHSLLEFYSSLSGGVEGGRIAQLADRFGLDLTKQVRALSKGNKQKVGVIQAFMHRPELLVLDEPTSGLDPLLQQEFLSLVREARRDGATVFLSSHVLSEIQHVADRVGILRDGEILTVSDVDSLRSMASRQIRFQLRETGAVADFSTVSGVESVTFEDDWTIVDVAWGSPLDPVFQKALTMGIDDVIAEEPDLERAVLDLYRGGELSLFGRPTANEEVLS